MKTGRSIALGTLAAGALALGTAAFAQDAKTPKPEAKPQTEQHEHSSGRGMQGGGHGMHRMGGQHGAGNGGCNGQAAGEHQHS